MLKEMQQKMNIKVSTLMRISDTRWICRYRNCKVVKDNYEVILEILRDEIHNNSDMDVVQAIGMYTILIIIN